MLAWLVMLLPVFFSKPCFSSSAYSLVPRPFQHVQEGQGTRLEGICDFLYHCPGSPQGWGRNCETNALSIPAVVPRRGGGVGHIIDRCITKGMGEPTYGFLLFLIASWRPRLVQRILHQRFFRWVLGAVLRRLSCGKFIIL